MDNEEKRRELEKIVSEYAEKLTDLMEKSEFFGNFSESLKSVGLSLRGIGFLMDIGKSNDSEDSDVSEKPEIKFEYKSDEEFAKAMGIKINESDLPRVLSFDEGRTLSMIRSTVRGFSLHQRLVLIVSLRNTLGELGLNFPDREKIPDNTLWMRFLEGIIKKIQESNERDRHFVFLKEKVEEVGRMIF